MQTTCDDGVVEARSGWSSVICLSLLTFVLVASEFMPVSLLTPIAADLGISEGAAGQAISISGLFAVVTSLFGNALLARLDRRNVVFLYTAVLVVAGLATTFAPNGFVFMLGRALIGIAVGGFWSLSTAILARIVSTADLPKAIAMLQGGTALASVVAAPLGSFLGGLVGWRGAFFVLVPAGVVAMLWQAIALPKMPASGSAPAGRMLHLLRSRVFALGMAATVLAFMGQFSVFTYLRPFLEGVAGFSVNGLSAALLGLGLAGLLGTTLAGSVVRSRLAVVLVGLPSVLALVAILLIALGSWVAATAALLMLWGFFTTPIPVAWNTWMTKVIPGDLEAGGALQVALIQFAITFGAFVGGLLFDAAGWWSPFALGAALLLGSAILAAATVTKSTTGEAP